MLIEQLHLVDWTTVKLLPDDLQVTESLIAYQCGLLSLPAGLKTQKVDIDSCPLEALPENLETEDLRLFYTNQLTTVPSTVKVTGRLEVHPDKHQVRPTIERLREVPGSA